MRGRQSIASSALLPPEVIRRRRPAEATMTNYIAPEGVYSEIASKFRRALRNGTGVTLSYAQLVALLHSDIYVLLAEAERQDLMKLHAQRTEET